MKLATIKDATRDGQLAVVSRDLKTAALADGIAGTLQHALDDWTFMAPQLQDLYDALNQGKARHAFEFDPTGAWRRCRAPTSGPTARPTSTTSNWCARRAMPRCPRPSGPIPLMYQGGSDDFLGPTDDAVLRFARNGASTSRPKSRSIVDDVPMGTDARRGAGAASAC